MSIQSTLPAFPSYPARMDYRGIAIDGLPDIEGWIHTSRGFPVPALCAPFPQFDNASDLYVAQQILSDARRLIISGSTDYICSAISRAADSRATMSEGVIIADDLRNYIAGCLEGKNAEVLTYSVFISMAMRCFSPEVILSRAERVSNCKDGRIFWIDWMLHQVAQQLTNFAGEQA